MCDFFFLFAQIPAVEELLLRSRCYFNYYYFLGTIYLLIPTDRRACVSRAQAVELTRFNKRDDIMEITQHDFRVGLGDIALV